MSWSNGLSPTMYSEVNVLEMSNFATCSWQERENVLKEFHNRKRGDICAMSSHYGYIHVMEMGDIYGKMFFISFIAFLQKNYLI